MTGTERVDAIMFRRIARRVEDILSAARDRERHGQSIALDIDARFRLEDMGAVQFQVASAILEETGGLRQEEVVGELLSLGLAAVLSNAARAAGQPADRMALDFLPDPELPLDDFSSLGGYGRMEEQERVLN